MAPRIPDLVLEGIEVPRTEMNRSLIQDFFEGKNILITGGTGFFGNVLIEKLLRSCSGIKKIYITARPRKGKTTTERIKEMFSGPLFAKLQEDEPNFAKKVAFVSADMDLEECGLSAEDQAMLKREIDVVFHAAATVRFDAELSTAINTNVRATRDLVNLAREMHNLKAFVFVSTIFSNCNNEAIPEKFCVPRIAGDIAIALNENVESDVINKMAPNLLDGWPNTYVFSKCLAEDVIKNLGKDMPMAVVRPSIVTSTAKEPIRGWINNLYGPTGVTAGAMKGILRTFPGDGECPAELVPVDYVINSIIACAWDTSTRFIEAQKRKERKAAINEFENIIGGEGQIFFDEEFDPFLGEEQRQKDFSIPVYNYVSTNRNGITWNEYLEMNAATVRNFPLKSAIWSASCTLAKTRVEFLFYSFFLHYLPALLADGFCTLVGTKPRFVRISQKIHNFSNHLSFFGTKNWKFEDNNVGDLWDRLTEMDKDIFYFNIEDLYWPEYFHYYVLGVREYLLQESLETVPEARRKMYRFFALQYLLVFLVFAVFTYGTFQLVGAFSSSESMILMPELPESIMV